jgi:hypothetical protein
MLCPQTEKMKGIFIFDHVLEEKGCFRGVEGIRVLDYMVHISMERTRLHMKNSRRAKIIINSFLVSHKFFCSFLAVLLLPQLGYF